jgi:hypothetical protein
MGVTIVKLQKENARLLRRVVDLEGMKEAAASDNDKLVKEKRELEGKEKQMRELKNVARAGKRNLRNALDTIFSSLYVSFPLLIVFSSFLFF